MALLDLEDYIAKKDEILRDYADREKWKRMVATNMANAGFFSSDRTIEEYNKDIWKLRQYPINNIMQVSKFDYLF